ncbi:prepilin-type N-terminal cleavage/methylation domain-containing protein [Phormidium sp. LEGE 05292]|uniref:prepilin-type N-terminal cleavage/methylation domain-containing protein n=1 Tax=[Phormidium] sp. LEGE 05292 TaxID=767427 RepID=UPI0018805A82|nr:prepilin-type N-terminal cleavage/methylation domain-containing protein [Phormidium sp. LEGE 05292]MBE9229329.1 prepilin-type N-terminal cleavage/methylation domain-containing protein [Phormidium sp. LEGE 05292]
MTVKLFQKILKLGGASSRKRSKNSGFTILELLVATLIATFVVVALLDFVVDLLQTDRREYARNETQREIQMALDYMVNDVREAAYIYDYAGLQKITDSKYMKLPPGYAPILAFWKPETIGDNDMGSLKDCNQFGTNNDKRTECDLLIIRRRAYTLVVYLQKVNDTNDKSQGWRGVSRIARLNIPKYTQTGVSSLTKTPGYVDPAEKTVKFETWPLDGTGVSLQNEVADGTAKGTTQVLVDFVDFPTKSRKSDLYSDTLTPPDKTQCPNNTNYSQIPSSTGATPTGATFDNPSFMVCVSTNNTIGAGALQSNVNQDVLIFLRGNPTGKAGVNVAPLLAVKTQAVARGVVDKQQ